VTPVFRLEDFYPAAYILTSPPTDFGEGGGNEKGNEKKRKKFEKKMIEGIGKN
jgi:hypothetical protein